MGGRGRPNRQPRRGNHHQSSDNTSTGSQPSSSSVRSNPRPPRPRNGYTSVPAYASISAGSGVSIVLKQDQPTGHQVQGIVADVLTRGDHPRGVKVRLRDGRVGRVQKLVGEAEGTRGENLVGGATANLGRDGEDGSRTSPGGRFRHTRDVREDDEYLFDESKHQSSSVGGLFAALEAADARHEQSRALGGAEVKGPEDGGQIAVCPVCGEFEGDAEAVAHHVEGHFG